MIFIIWQIKCGQILLQIVETFGESDFVVLFYNSPFIYAVNSLKLETLSNYDLSGCAINYNSTCFVFSLP